MSNEAMAIAMNHSRATGAARMILVGIANHDGDGGSWPAVNTLARYAGVGPRYVKRCLQELEELGEIRREVMGGGTRNTPDWSRPNLYHVTLACPANCDGTKNHKLCKRCGEDAPGVRSKTYVCPACLAAPVDNSQGGEVAQETPGGPQTTPPVVQGPPPPVVQGPPEPPLEPSMNANLETSSSTTRGAEGYPQPGRRPAAPRGERGAALVRQALASRAPGGQVDPQVWETVAAQLQAGHQVPGDHHTRPTSQPGRGQHGPMTVEGPLGSIPRPTTSGGRP